MPIGIYKHKPHSEKAKKKMSKSHKGKKLSERHRRNISLGLKGKPSNYKGKRHLEKTKRKISQILIGRKRSRESIEKQSKITRGRKRSPFSKEWKENISKGHKGMKLTEEHKRKISEAHRKKWDKIGRKKCKRCIHFCNTYQYKKWRMSVFSRDNFTCQFCGNRGYIEAHHIKSWAKYPKLRYKVENGITLCEDCHKLANKIQKYGY